jgi:hypothetical protein
MMFLGGLCLGFPWIWIRIVGAIALATAIILGFVFQKKPSRLSTKKNDAGIAK